ncbi:L,D-transpeptidase [Mesorhizobium sp. BHbdii]
MKRQVPHRGSARYDYHRWQPAFSLPCTAGSAGHALRYRRWPGGVWAGIVRVGRMAEWPTWTPPAEMIVRDPNAVKHAGGMPGEPDNPLGARALYLYERDQDTIYRIHGTPEPWTIGLDVSSGVHPDAERRHHRFGIARQAWGRGHHSHAGAALYRGV